jgi:transcription initiation factor IIE alpha subunit
MTQQDSNHELKFINSKLIINQNKRCFACNSPDILTGYEYREHNRLTKFICSKCGWSVTLQSKNS